MISSTFKPCFVLLSLFIYQTTASPAGFEAILDPIGDVVQVAPNLELHQKQAEKLQESASEKSIKTPAGTVKCSCKTVDEYQEYLEATGNENLKTIEIEIQPPVEEGDLVKIPEGREDTVGEPEPVEDEEDEPILVKNSFTLEGEEGNPQVDQSDDLVFNTGEPTSFLSYLSALISSSAKEQAASEPQSEFWRGSQPENGEGEVEQESEYDEMADPHDLDTVTIRVLTKEEFLTTRKPIYKAFRSTDLLGATPPIPLLFSKSESEAEKMKNTGNLQDEFFMWDFMYSGNPMEGKKREIASLGTVMNPFKGPRRRRRRRALRGNGNQSPVYFVYPVGYNPVPSPTPSEQKKDVVIPKNETTERIQLRANPPPEPDLDEINRAMQAALDRAWQQYGPKGQDAPPVTPAPPAPVVVIPASEEPPVPPLPVQNAQTRLIQQQQQKQRLQQTQAQNQQDLVFYSPPRPFLFIDRIFNPFQPMTSEWDKHVSSAYGPPRPPPEPGFFSRFLASYIDFEVNNHETADLMRKVVFGVFVGFLIAGWVALGAAFGIVPLKKLLGFIAGTGYTSANKRIDKGKDFMLRDTSLADITDKILLSLDGDWLKKLEERVIGTDGTGTKILTQVFCCVLPDQHTKGMVECQVSKNGRVQANSKKTPFKCVSDLMYTFRFGEREDDDEEEVELDNNVKGKATTDE